MRRVLRAHGATVAVIAGLLALSLVVTGYILVNQRVALPGWLPGGADPYRTFSVELSTAQAVTPGQGQQVLISGVDVGDITDVRLERGIAVAEIRVKERHARLLREDATALLRPKSGLYDMSIELQPGSRGARPAPAGFRIPDARTASNVHLDEVLASLDGDTRLALQLLVDGLGRGLRPDGRALARTLQQLSPLARNMRAIGTAMEDRQRQVRRAVTVVKRVTEALAENRGDVVRAVRSSDGVLGTMGRRDGELRAALRELPATLTATDAALGSGTRLAQELRPATRALSPVARELEPTLRASRPFLRATEPVLRRQLLPFARQTRLPTRRLRGFAERTHEVHGDSDAVSEETQRLLNMIAYDPPGKERGFLFYQLWVNQNLPWVYSTKDAHGPIRRTRLNVSCSSLATLSQLAEVNPSVAFLGNVLDQLGRTSACPPPTREGEDATGGPLPKDRRGDGRAARRSAAAAASGVRP
ncbi:MlaD family protein [Patulibacter medicamentivorans]|uniref:MlaD family protein n=1 Tax=Patulibacter medicamentivorans TaxID=1097667 RepID=UPI00058F8E3F|nr:MlaD family protein [Patulibacter medicamentivorans]